MILIRLHTLIDYVDPTATSTFVVVADLAKRAHVVQHRSRATRVGIRCAGYMRSLLLAGTGLHELKQLANRQTIEQFDTPHIASYLEL